MSTALRRVGGAAAAYPWRTLATWLLLVVVAIGLNAGFGGQTRDNYDVQGMQSQEGTEFLRATFPEMSGADARLIVHDRSGAALDPTVLAAVRTGLQAAPSASVVSEPRMSADRDTALLSVQYDVPVTAFRGREGVVPLEAAAAPALDAGLRVEYGGTVPELASGAQGTAELIGIVVALVILVLALGSLVGAGLPLAVAFTGLAVGSSIIGLMAALTDISGTAPTIATMVGLGVGIDYALLLVSRHVEGLRHGLTPRQAATEATATAGTSVVIAGLTVLVSLFGLALTTLPVHASFGYATFATVSAVVLASITLVPALCVLAGRRVLPRRERRASAVAPVKPVSGRRTRKWAARIAARPVTAVMVATVVLLTLAVPALFMRTWPQDAGSQPESNTTRRAYDLVSAEYGPGANGPLLVAVDLSTVPSVKPLADALARMPGVAGVTGPVPNAAGDAAVIFVEPATGPQQRATTKLLTRIRDQLPEGAYVTGIVAIFADVSQRLAERLWVVIGFVVALSLVLLTVLLRAPVVAVKAAVVNLLSVAAAYGVITAVFQTDVGARLVGLPQAGAVSSWVPILMFVVLFGLSMDYEVFLLSRVREDWLATGDPIGSVGSALASTGRVITSAAAIMVAVFLGFAFDPDVTVKTIGLGMAVAIAIDATVVRMVLVPAAMVLLGRNNWWLPRWLDRILPKVDHGAAVAPKAAPAEPHLTGA